MCIDLGHNEAVQGVLPARVVLAKTEPVNCVTNVKFFSAKGYQVVHVNPASLKRPPRCKMEVACYLQGNIRNELTPNKQKIDIHKETWQGLSMASKTGCFATASQKSHISKCKDVN